MGSYMQQRHQTSCVFGWIKFAILIVVISVLFQGVLCDVEPTESQCRTFIEKALKEHSLDTNEKIPENAAVGQSQDEQEKNSPTDEFTDLTEGSNAIENDEDEADVKREDDDIDDNDDDNNNENGEEDAEMEEQIENEKAKTDEKDDEVKVDSREENLDLEAKEGETGYQDTEDDTKEEETKQDEEEEREQDEEEGTNQDEEETIQDEEDINQDEEGTNQDEDDKEVISEEPIEIEVQEIELDDSDENRNDEEKPETEIEEKYPDDKESDEIATEKEDENEQEKVDQDTDSVDIEDRKDSHEDRELTDDEKEKGENDGEEVDDDEADEDKTGEENKEKEVNELIEEENEIKEKDFDENETDDKDEEKASEDGDGEKKVLKRHMRDVGVKHAAESEVEEEDEGSFEEKGQEAPEEELIKEMVIPDNLRPRSHISKILKLEDSNMENILEKTIDTTLKALKGLYDNAIKPLEMLYKYRDLSNRHFGDPEIFSKPLILFMGPWSGGKSSTINYLLDNEFSHTSLRTGAEPSPAYFNILMYGEEEEILDGTQLAADWTFSGLQKFGQVLLDRLRGIKLPNKLLEKVNIVEIPGILEIRKQVQRLFPFNDACQWFIDRADIIFLVYDPSKLDVGPETEAILDQLKGREYQTRIILNKADQVKPEELMRVQGTLIWNISPLMSSSEPPIMYSTSLWSLPYENGAPIRLLQAQERAFLRDLREAIDKRVENKIASARRFAVRVRNHAKMVDCYLTTYYNHKTIFGNRKKVSDDIIEFPQKYHIYEGLSTLTNISRYDLPDPDVYRDFFKINPLYEFKKLSETCTYFRGCPINKLDVAIAYDLPELVGKYKKAVETAKEDLQKGNT